MKKNKYYEIPFHNGAFEDFRDISYTISYNRYYRNFRFDLVTNSNFFTKANKQEFYKKEIANTIRKIKSNGFFITLSSQNYDFYLEYKKYLKGVKSYWGKDVYKLREILDVNSNEFKENTKKIVEELIVNFEEYFKEIASILNDYKLLIEPEKKQYLNRKINRKKLNDWKTIVMKKKRVSNVK